MNPKPTGSGDQTESLRMRIRSLSCFLRGSANAESNESNAQLVGLTTQALTHAIPLFSFRASLEVGSRLGDMFGSKQTVSLPSQPQLAPPAETPPEVRIDMEDGAGQVFAPGQGLVSWGSGGDGRKEVICQKPTPGGSDVQPTSTLTSASKALHDQRYEQQAWTKRTSGQQGGAGGGDILPGGWGGGGGGDPGRRSNHRGARRWRRVEGRAGGGASRGRELSRGCG